MLVLNLSTTGFSESSGKSLSIRLMASRTSFVASSRLMPHSNSRIISEIFSLDDDVSFFRSFTVLRLSSSKRVILVSMSAALAPG